MRQPTNTRASRTLIVRCSTPMLSPPIKVRSTNELCNKVPSTKVKTYGHCKYVIAGAKQTSNGAIKNNICSLPLSSQNTTAALISRSLTKLDISANLVASSTNEQPLDQRSGHFFTPIRATNALRVLAVTVHISVPCLFGC